MIVLNVSNVQNDLQKVKRFFIFFRSYRSLIQLETVTKPLENNNTMNMLFDKRYKRFINFDSAFLKRIHLIRLFRSITKIFFD